MGDIKKKESGQMFRLLTGKPALGGLGREDCPRFEPCESWS